MSGARDETERILAELIAAGGDHFYPAFPIATIQMGLGHTDERQTGYDFPSTRSTTLCDRALHRVDATLNMAPE